MERATQGGRLARRECTHGTTVSLRQDILDVLTARADTRQISVLGRGDRATHYTGSQLLEEAENCLKDWATCLGNGPQVMIAALPFGEAFLFPLLASLIGEGCLVPIAPPRPSDAPGRMRHIVENCGATVVLCTSAHQAAVAAQLCDDEGNQICPVYVVDGPNVPLATFNSAPKIVAPIIQHTSGSTRFPKAVPITAQQIRANCAMIQRLWGVNAETVTVNWLPHYHDMGLMGGILYTLLSGGQSLQMSPFEMIRSPLSWLKAISTYRATFSGGPAFAFQECLNRVPESACDTLDLSSWKRAFCGAEPIPADLLGRFSTRFAKQGLDPKAAFACYGMAEYTLFIAGEPGIPATEATLSNSTVAPCLLSAETRANIRICDPNSGHVLPEGATGELWLRGGSAAAEYIGQTKDTSQTFVQTADGESWLRTGDLGRVSGQFLLISGRLKDIIITNGQNVAAAEIEWLAAKEDTALNPMGAAVFVPPGAPNGHAALFIEVRQGMTPQRDHRQLVSAIRRSVTGTYSIKLDDIRILPRGELPRTSSGKIRRQVLADTYVANPNDVLRRE